MIANAVQINGRDVSVEWSRAAERKMACRNRNRSARVASVSTMCAANGWEIFEYKSQTASAAGAPAVMLHRRARHTPVGTIHTAVPRLGFEQGVAVGAFVEPLAGILWHGFQFAVPTVRAREQRFKNGLESWHDRLVTPVIIARFYPRVLTWRRKLLYLAAGRAPVPPARVCHRPISPSGW